MSSTGNLSGEESRFWWGPEVVLCDLTVGVLCFTQLQQSVEMAFVISYFLTKETESEGFGNSLHVSMTSYPVLVSAILITHFPLCQDAGGQNTLYLTK